MTYSDGPYTLGPGITLQGSGAGVGAGATALTLPANASPQTYVTVNGGTLRNLRVSMSGLNSTRRQSASRPAAARSSSR